MSCHFVFVQMHTLLLWHPFFLLFTLCKSGYDCVNHEDCTESAFISCSNTHIVVEMGSAIELVECLDSNAPHLPLEATNLLMGLDFDGRYLSGSCGFVVTKHPIFVYNNNSSLIITVDGIFVS